MAVPRPRYPLAVRRAMSEQLDLAQLRSGAGLVLYENLAYTPLAASVPGRVPVDSARPNRAALETNLARAVPLTGGARRCRHHPLG